MLTDNGANVDHRFWTEWRAKTVSILEFILEDYSNTDRINCCHDHSGYWEDRFENS